MKRWSHLRRRTIKTPEQKMAETVEGLSKVWDLPATAAVKLQVMLSAPELYREIEERVQALRAKEAGDSNDSTADRSI